MLYASDAIAKPEAGRRHDRFKCWRSYRCDLVPGPSQGQARSWKVSGANGTSGSQVGSQHGQASGDTRRWSSDYRCRWTAHQAMPGDVRRRWGCALGAGGRGFESRHPDQLYSNVLSIAGSQGDSWCLSRHVGRRGSVSAHVGSHLRGGLTSSCVSNFGLSGCSPSGARQRVICRSGLLATCRRSTSGACGAGCSVYRARPMLPVDSVFSGLHADAPLRIAIPNHHDRRAQYPGPTLLPAATPITRGWRPWRT